MKVWTAFINEYDKIIYLESFYQAEDAVKALFSELYRLELWRPDDVEEEMEEITKKLDEYHYSEDETPIEFFTNVVGEGRSD